MRSRLFDLVLAQWVKFVYAGLSEGRASDAWICALVCTFLSVLRDGPAAFAGPSCDLEGGDAMAWPFIGEWIRLIRPLLPRSARIEVGGGNDLVLQIDWLLGNDPTRPHKRSRVIRVVVPQKAIDDCADFKTAGSQFKKVIEHKLSLFNPDHNTRRCGRRPTEEWVVAALDAK